MLRTEGMLLILRNVQETCKHLSVPLFTRVTKQTSKLVATSMSRSFKEFAALKGRQSRTLSLTPGLHDEVTQFLLSELCPPENHKLYKSSEKAWWLAS